jgi:hypothetical protein
MEKLVQYFSNHPVLAGAAVLAVIAGGGLQLGGGGG